MRVTHQLKYKFIKPHIFQVISRRIQQSLTAIQNHFIHFNLQDETVQILLVRDAIHKIQEYQTYVDRVNFIRAFL